MRINATIPLPEPWGSVRTLLLPSLSSCPLLDSLWVGIIELIHMWSSSWAKWFMRSERHRATQMCIQGDTGNTQRTFVWRAYVSSPRILICLQRRVTSMGWWFQSGWGRYQEDHLSPIINIFSCLWLILSTTYWGIHHGFSSKAIILKSIWYYGEWIMRYIHNTAHYCNHNTIGNTYFLSIATKSPI